MFGNRFGQRVRIIYVMNLMNVKEKLECTKPLVNIVHICHYYKLYIIDDATGSKIRQTNENSYLPVVLSLFVNE